MNKKRQTGRAKFFVKSLLIVCVLGALFLFFNNKEEPVPHNNPVDMKISQYSDKNITPNAVATDSEFEHIAFDTYAAKKPPFFSSQIAAAVRAVKLLNPLGKKKYARENGTWLWTPVMDMTAEYMESMLSDAKANGINAVYLSVDTYLDIFVMEKGKERERKKEAFSEKLDNFISRANRKGIAVDAEAGWRNWAEESNTYKAFAVVNYVKKFNAEHENKFRGFQYDVEPYLLDSYEKNKSSALKNFIELVDKTENFLGTSTLNFSVVVPDFYDRKDGMTPKFLYNGRKDYAFGHLLEILDRRPGGSIIIMSYRNFADGRDGAIEISRNEMQTARREAYGTKIIIAQETGNVPPPFITFHNTSKRYLSVQIDKINSAFKPYSSFGGIAIHYANAFLALR